MSGPRKVLVTGARAPAALELIRRLGCAGHTVLAADCVRAPVGRFSRHVRRYFRVPAPREDPCGFIASVRDIAAAEKVDVLVPTCEEIYHLGLQREKLDEVCAVFCPDPATLLTLHHKGRFARLTHALEMAVVTPESVPVTDASERRRLARESRAWVFKPVYSRSAARTLIRPSAEAVNRLALDPVNPWLAQRFVAGRELSSYGVAVRGRLQAHVLYRSRHRAGQAAGIYFVPEENVAAQRFVEGLTAHLGFTGQIAFDFIECADTGRLFVLECNPRATSGVHLLDPDFDLGAALCGDIDGSPPGATARFSRPPMVGAAMLTAGLGHALRTGQLASWWRDFAAGRDVVFARDDPLPCLGQLASLAELMVAGWRQRAGLLAAASADIEWNGSPHTGSFA